MPLRQDPWRPMPSIPSRPSTGHDGETDGYSTLLMIFIPILVVVLTVLLGLVVFLVAVLYMRRRKGIRLTEDGGPLDLSRGDGVIGEGGVEGVEARWLESLDPDVKEAYKRAKDWQLQYPPSSIPTDITLSQFLSIQEKGVSAWAFEPDYEENLSLYVQSRTEITFLADGPGMPAREGGGNSVMANLPLPKLNEVYYWEVKMYEKPANTEIAIGLATKPYPSFRLPGWNKYSVAYFASDGFKSHNYPFTASSHGPPLAEGDVLGVGYRPRTGTVFFTRNGRKMDDAFTGLQKLNLFPTVGANGPCTIHVNLGQAGFVFIEANVKKWGLAPMSGTLAPPPAYGSERGSILLDAGYGTPGANSSMAANLGGVNALLEAARARSGSGSGAGQLGTWVGSSAGSLPATPSPRTRKHRRPSRLGGSTSSVPTVPSPLRAGAGADSAGPSARRRAFGPAASAEAEQSISPTDTSDDDGESGSSSSGDPGDRARESSPIEHNPPTPNLLDISMHSLRNSGQYFSQYNGAEEDGEGSGSGSGSGESDATARPERLTLGPSPDLDLGVNPGAGTRPGPGAGSGRRRGRGRSADFGVPEGSPPPPGYAPLDPHVYAAGLPGDLPEDMVNQAIAAMSDSDQAQPPAQAQGQDPLRDAQEGDGQQHGLLGWLRIGHRSSS